MIFYHNASLTNIIAWTGPVLDYDYRIIARKYNININVRSGDDVTDFPIEKARFRSIWYMISAAGVCMVGYGWALHSKLVSCSNYRGNRYRQLI